MLHGQEAGCSLIAGVSRQTARAGVVVARRWKVARTAQLLKYVAQHGRTVVEPPQPPVHTPIMILAVAGCRQTG
jgi:hypothetical protein